MFVIISTALLCHGSLIIHTMNTLLISERQHDDDGRLSDICSINSQLSVRFTKLAGIMVGGVMADRIFLQELAIVLLRRFNLTDYGLAS